MKNLNILKLTVAALLLVAANSFAQSGTIVNSEHDFSVSGWAQGEICLVCHAAHNNINTTGEMLWNHELSVQTYTVYSSPTFSQAAGQPSGASKLCLSCHDGTVAVDSFGGATGGEFLEGGASFGTDLGNDHPISFPYVVGVGEELFATDSAVTFGDGSTGTIADMLFGTDVECSSCHDVHNTKSGSNSTLLLIDNDASALCLTCHNK